MPELCPVTRPAQRDTTARCTDAPTRQPRDMIVGFVVMIDSPDTQVSNPGLLLEYGAQTR